MRFVLRDGKVEAPLKHEQSLIHKVFTKSLGLHGAAVACRLPNGRLVPWHGSSFEVLCAVFAVLRIQEMLACSCCGALIMKHGKKPNAVVEKFVEDRNLRYSGNLMS